MSTWESEIIVNPYVQEAIEDLIIPGVNLNSYGAALTEEDINSICEDLNAATCFLIEFAQDSIDEETALDALEHYTQEHGTDMDEYLDTVIDNLESFLECPTTQIQNQIESNPMIFPL